MLSRIPEQRVGVRTEYNSGLSFCSVNESNASEEDEFINPANPEPAQNRAEISNSFIRIFNNFRERFYGIFDMFSPLLSFTKNLIGENDTTQPQNNEQLIKNFSGLLQSTRDRVTSQHLISRESQRALNELTSAVSHLQQNNNNIDLGSIIVQWRTTRNAQHLLQMAAHLEGGRCVSLNETQLRELRGAFIRGLRSLASAIKDAEERGEVHASEHLHNAANPLVSGVERAHEASQREDTGLTYDDRRFMGERLQESSEQVKEGVRNGVFNGLDDSIVHELDNWTNYIYDFITDFFEELEKEKEEDEEKAEKEKQCEQRHEEQKEIRFLHALHKSAEIKKLFFQSIMKKAILEANIAWRIVRNELNNIIVNHSRCKRETERAKREDNYSLGAEYLYKKEAGRESYFESSEQNLTENLPSALVCEHESSSGFIFDVHC